MPKYSIIGPGYLGRSSNVNASRCINLYPELNSQDSKSVGSLVGTPGLLLFVDTLLGTHRGAHFFNNLIYFVAGNKLYSVDAAKNVTPIVDSGTGVQVTLATSTGRVSMADNGMYSVNGAVANQLAFVDGQNVYVVNVTTLVSFSTAIPAKTIAFIGGYFMVDAGGAKFEISALYDGTSWPGLAISTADAYPDNLQATVNNHNEAWQIGEYSAEVWQMDGSSNPMPFTRVAVLDYGTPSPASVAKGSNTLFWLVAQRNGDAGEVFGIGMADGYGVQIVSPQAINDQISRYSQVSDAWGYCYTDRGHEFYVLTFPTANATWVYDAAAKLWHERSYYAGSPYVIGRHIANSYVYAWGKHYVGSYLDGKVYEMSENYLDDAGVPIASVRVSPPIEDKTENGNVFISKLQVDAETGVWLTSPVLYTVVITADVAGTNIQFIDATGDGLGFISTGNIVADTERIYGPGPGGAGGVGAGNVTGIVPTWIDPTNHALGFTILWNVNLARFPGAIFSVRSLGPGVVINVTSVMPSPQAVLSWSDDGGHTWSNDHVAPMGRQGEYRARVIWRRLGAARNRTFRLAISEPIKKVLIGSYMDMEGEAT